MFKVRKITVLEGGWSPEREISLQSGQYIASLLRKGGFDVYELDVKKDLAYITQALYKSDPDYIYNALHGIGGEDGVIQGILEIFGKPYSNSNVLSSALCFDKQICKMLVKASGVNVVPGNCIHVSGINNVKPEEFNLDYPFVMKPACNGSSIGVFIIYNEEELNKIKENGWAYGSEIIIEQYISGRELTVLVMDGQAIGALEILPINKFYDFDSKYKEGGSQHVSNYDLDTETETKMFEMSQNAYKACKCTGIARVDLRYDGKEIYFLEINTQPGMTSKSLVPDIFKNKNLSFVDVFKNSIKN
ncbi:MAG: D-alanine--D-alanine ligase [Alphaproteobacteria bacterium]|nr:D-alanine--D-alanine ligase [Alphaproteobacteria bacterium]